MLGSEFVTEEGLERKPIEIIDGFEWSLDAQKYTPPFASRDEVNGLLSGSEKSVLISSKGESIYSVNFSECSGALVRNRQTGIITLIHESLWSEAASAVFALQKTNDLDVITIAEPARGIPLNRIERTHGIGVTQLLDLVGSGSDKQVSDKVRKLNWSTLIGLTDLEIRDMLKVCESSNVVGDTRHVGDIKIPLAGREGWDLLYRPKENIIWIYEPEAKRLYKYQGF